MVEEKSEDSDRVSTVLRCIYIYMIIIVLDALVLRERERERGRDKWTCITERMRKKGARNNSVTPRVYNIL